jgi:hypothetical protein
MLHLARSRGFPVVHLHWTAHESNKESDVRLRSKILSEKSRKIITKTIQLKKGNDGNRKLGFSDRCLYDGYDKHNKIRDTRPNPDISVADTDYIGFDFQSIAHIACALNMKRVIFLGIHTNMCIQWVSIYCSWLGIESVFVQGLLDSAYWYPLQKWKGIESHSAMNEVVYEWFAKEHGLLVRSYDLLQSLMNAPCRFCEVKWVLNPECALPFMRFYGL